MAMAGFSMRERGYSSGFIVAVGRFAGILVFE